MGCTGCDLQVALGRLYFELYAPNDQVGCDLQVALGRLYLTVARYFR